MNDLQEWEQGMFRARAIARLLYPASFISGLCFLCWSIWRLQVFYDTTSANSLHTWQLLVLPLLLLNSSTWVIAYLLGQELGSSAYLFRYPVRLVLLLALVVGGLWMLNIGLELVLGPLQVAPLCTPC